MNRELSTNTLSQMAPKDSAYMTGYVAGNIFVALLLLALVLKCFSIARRPATNGKCAASLGVILAGWFIAATGASLAKFFPGSPTLLSAFGGLALLASIVLGILLAVLGLAEYRDARGRFTQGKVQAILALVFGGLFMLLVGVGAVAGFQRARTRNMASTQPSADQVLAFENLNYKFKVPGKPWVQLDAKKFNPASSLVLMRSFPETYFMVVAERTGTDLQLDNERLVEIAQGNLSSRAVSTRFLKRGPVQRQGLSGLQWEAETRFASYDALYLQWVCATNGYAYQLICWGKLAEAQRLRDEAERLFSRFDLLDPRRLGTLERELALRD